MQDPYSFLQAEKERREKAKFGVKKQTAPTMSQAMEKDGKNKNKVTVVKKFI